MSTVIIKKNELIELLQDVCPKATNNPSVIPQPIDPLYYKRAVVQFLRYVHSNHWMVEEYQTIARDWEATNYKLFFIARLQKEDCLRLVTMFVHQNNKTAGVLENVCEKGYIKAIIQRLLEV